ncbi:hypothetical protein T11_2519 [Trichinella zimbabwensis]|uniref:Uncharacterized protein n=1 Tax=Trichinella zimbabwensis TaxID=268475 RepID=A0A0V1H3B0_9BILA|nr:hypothetical protein T11_2519 [Trichinella zimbabwensis]
MISICSNLLSASIYWSIILYGDHKSLYFAEPSNSLFRKLFNPCQEGNQLGRRFRAGLAAQNPAKFGLYSHPSAGYS